jgi:hypothetical protein
MTLMDEPSVDEILAQMQDAKPAPEPGTLRVRDVLHKGDEEVPVPVRASALNSAGYRFIYDTKTGERSITNRNMLPAQLQKKRPDGTPYFTVRQPKVESKIQAQKCWLHAESAERELFDAMGLPVCAKANLANAHQAELHVKKKHPAAYAAIKDAREKAEKEQDRALQRRMLEAMTRSSPPVLGEDKPKGGKAA